jgi:hypothetical protein
MGGMPQMGMMPQMPGMMNPGAMPSPGGMQNPQTIMTPKQYEQFYKQWTDMMSNMGQPKVEGAQTQ